MNLLQLLLGSMTSTNTVNSVSKKTGVSSDLTTKLLIAAIPVLITYMTKNAKSKSGAQSLLGALGQHTETTTIEQQVANADTTDGNKIISHILGNDQNKVVDDLASQTGLNTTQVNNTLSTVAPALLSSLSAATTTTSTATSANSGLDVGSLLSMFTGTSASQNTGSNAAASLLGSLLGSSTTSTAASSKTASNNTAASALGLLGSLVSTDTSTKAATTNSSSNGTELLGLLSSLMK